MMNKNKQQFASVIQGFFHFPVFLVCIVLICLIVKEYFPFSHFPMYARLYESNYYFIVEDQNNQNVKFNAVSPEKIRKLFISRKSNYELQLEEQGLTKKEIEIEISKEVLSYLAARIKSDSAEDITELNFYRVDITVSGNKIQRDKVFITGIEL